METLLVSSLGGYGYTHWYIVPLEVGIGHDDARFALDELFIAACISTRKQKISIPKVRV
jgi:hypothetical protein